MQKRIFKKLTSHWFRSDGRSKNEMDDLVHVSVGRLYVDSVFTQVSMSLGRKDCSEVVVVVVVVVAVVQRKYYSFQRLYM